MSVRRGRQVEHNLVAGVGAMQGDDGDLARGLPLQSTHDDVGRPHHDPVRLTTVVAAPVETIEAVIAANPVLRRLFGGGWVRLGALDPIAGRAMLRDEDGRWADWDGAEGRAVLSPTGLAMRGA